MLLAAGGTGGHLFVAEALAHELIARGYAVHLATDARAKRYASDFPAGKVHVIPSATFAGKNPFLLAKALFDLSRGLLRSSALIRRLDPVAVAGFGGYPTVPPLFAAARMGVPTLIHDANAVMGRANKWLAPRVDKVAMGFAGGFNAAGQGEVVVTGNPVRPAILEAARLAYPARKAGEPFNLLVFGGSQGAQYFSQSIPAAIGLMDVDVRKHIELVQQARPEDEAAVKAAYHELGVKAEVAPFFADMARRLAAAHLVIARGGAGTVSELAVIGRPAILVPYPYALDHDQKMNAASMAEAGGAWIEVQKDLSPERLAKMITDAIADPAGLASAAKKAKKAGKPDATKRLADSIEQIVARGRAKDFKGTNS